MTHSRCDTSGDYAPPAAPVRQRAGGREADSGSSRPWPAFTSLNQFGVQPKLTLSAPNDPFEREADRIADDVVSDRHGSALPRAVTPLVQRQEEDEEEELQAKSAVLQRQAEREDEDDGPDPHDRMLQRRPGPGSAATTGSGPGGARHAADQAAAAVARGGRPLSRAERAYFEPRLGRDLSPIRIHDDGRAGAMARNINARAYTHRHNIAFAPGAYDGRSLASRRLMAHELVHTLQQSSASELRRKPADEPEEISASAVFPFKKGARVQILRTMPEGWYRTMTGFVPASEEAFKLLETKIFEVTAVGDDHIEFMLEGEITLPLGTDGAPKTYKDLSIRFERDSGNVFNLGARAASEDEDAPESLSDPVPVTIQKTEDGFSLSIGGLAVAMIKPGEAGSVDLAVMPEGAIEALPEEAKEDIPDKLGKVLPESIDVIGLNQLPEVEKGSSEETQAMEKNVSRARSRTRRKSQKLTLGTGLTAAEQFNPMLEASWQINFTPIKVTGGLVQFPLRVAVQYAPTATVLGKISSGVDLSFAQLDVPINIQLIAGGAGGVVRERDIKGKSTGPLRPAGGLVAGAGLGVELKTFRMDLRYEHLFNLVSNSPNAHSIGLHFGGSF